MKKFANLLEQLLFTYSTNRKIDILATYLKSLNHKEKGITIAVLTGNLNFKNIKRSNILNIIKDKLDWYLFEQSYDYVGDLAETIALIWPSIENSKQKNLNDIVCDLKNSKNINNTIIEYLNSFSSKERWAFIKFILGGLRIGFSTSLVKKSLAKYGNKQLYKIENIWNGLEYPYENLFLWLENKGSYPSIDASKTFNSFMLATSFDEELIEDVKSSNDYYFEYKWDGIRVQLVAKDGSTTIFSRSGEDISNSFPEIKINCTELLVLDGEMLVGQDYSPLPFNQLQKRINKKKPSKKLLSELPAFVKIYDILYYNGQDIRNRTLYDRRKKLEEWFLNNSNANLKISELINFKTNNELKKIYQKFSYIEGIMIKKKLSFYLSGRKKGYWFKWKKDPKYIDTILMYAQRGHGKRSSFYSDYTLGIWSKNKVIPIAKAYSGYTDDELNKIDRFIRKNTIAKYGPVREVRKSLVIELAFDSAQISSRHKSGIALRFPRVSRIRWDKPVNDVQSIEEIKKELSIYHS